MPRIYDGYNDPHDFCRRHFPSEQEAQRRFGAGTGPDNRGNCFTYDAEHPDYENENYHCDHKGCGKLLSADDNG
jgi:hypothetical protein